MHITKVDAMVWSGTRRLRRLDIQGVSVVGYLGVAPLLGSANCAPLTSFVGEGVPVDHIARVGSQARLIFENAGIESVFVVFAFVGEVVP